MRRSIAVVGSGPAGCYLAQFLQRQVPEADITIFERLPVPYGLLRYGVAPDHQGTKAVIEQFDRMFARGGVQFAGNIEVGVDISLQSLRDAFEVVVLATGVASDRRLGIRGEETHGVYGAGRLTRLINSHPDEDEVGVELGGRTLIVGNGNVAIDVLRILIKTEADFLNSDVDDTIRNNLATGLREVSIVGRSLAHVAKFDKTLIRELGRVRGVRFRMHGLVKAVDPMDSLGQAKVEELCSLEQAQETGPPRMDVHFYFGWVPERVNGQPRANSMTFHPLHEDSAPLTIETDSVITAVGFAEGAQDTFVRGELMGNATDTKRGVLDAGLYCTGWFGKGASGTIPEHRAESRSLASAIATDLSSIAAEGKKNGLVSLPASVLTKVVDFDGWKEIDQFELASAAKGRYRRKVRTRAELLAVAGKESIPSHEKVS